MLQFAVGTRVKCIKSFGKHVLKGVEYTVIETDNSTNNIPDSETFGKVTTVQRDDGVVETCYAFRFEEVFKFNLATATDQELANEYRDCVNKGCDIVAELRRRGYTVTCKNGRLLSHENRERFISKTETTSL